MYMKLVVSNMIWQRCTLSLPLSFSLHLVMATSYPQEVIMHCFINNIFFICKKMFYIYPYVNKTHSLERLCTYIVHSSLEQVINIYGRVWRVEINVYNFIFFSLHIHWSWQLSKRIEFKSSIQYFWNARILQNGMCIESVV